MRPSTISGTSILSFAVLVLGLTFGSAVKAQAQAQSQPCTPAATQAGTAQQQSPQSGAQTGQNVINAFKSLGSVFSKKAQPAAGVTAAPCPSPAAAAAPATAPDAQQAASASASSQGGTAAPWSPGDAGAPQAAPTASAFTGTLDPAKLPDIAGIHMGMTIDEAMAILKKMHGGNVNLSSAGNPVVYTRANYETNKNPSAGDGFQVGYTFPPGPQRVVAIQHTSSYYPQVSHANMVDALRAKYGRETLAIAGPAPAKPGEDARITGMIWLFDENGKTIKPGPVSNLSPYGCGEDYYGSNGVAINTLVNQYLRNELPAPKFCDSLIILSVAFSADETIYHSQATIIENGLLLRSVKTTGDYQANLAKRQHEQQLQQANQTKPSL